MTVRFLIESEIFPSEQGSNSMEQLKKDELKPGPQTQMSDTLQNALYRPRSNPENKNTKEKYVPSNNKSRRRYQRRNSKTSAMMLAALEASESYEGEADRDPQESVSLPGTLFPATSYPASNIFNRRLHFNVDNVTSSTKELLPQPQNQRIRRSSYHKPPNKNEGNMPADQGESQRRKSLPIFSTFHILDTPAPKRRRSDNSKH
mmetsp:Transcript_8879/g.12598  ORF Transcript_8879/g.12598 Transcript_8879/m.12598 type:complete len:204 (+) Transcript_8879:248-859(+)